jgi:hypothetical protein
LAFEPPRFFARSLAALSAALTCLSETPSMTPRLDQLLHELGRVALVVEDE